MKQLFQEIDIREEWLVFLGQVPASPSSVRVAMWRRLRAAGAASFFSGAWVLPNSQASVALFSELANTAREHRGNGVVFATRSLKPEDRQEVIERFRLDRGREYAEFSEKTQSFLDEIELETKRKKFTFAELEEIEEDFHKLTAWLSKIKARDFYPAEQARNAAKALSECRAALHGFSKKVYRADSADVPKSAEENPVERPAERKRRTDPSFDDERNSR